MLETFVYVIYGKLAAQVFLNKMQNFKAPVDTLQQMDNFLNLRL
jgi:hypothetical protein